MGTTHLAVHDGLKTVPCPVCSAPEHHFYTWAPSHYGPERYQITQCNRCSMIFTNPQPTTYLSEVLERGVTDGHFVPDKLGPRLRTAEFILSCLHRIAPGKRVLDFGCGEGAFVAQAVREGWDATGIDLNRGLVLHAQKHWNLESALHPVSLDDFVASGPAAFDAIVAFQVFEHLQNPIGIGQQLVRMLKPGGILYLDVPNAHQPREWFARGKTLDPTAHWNHFTVETLSRLMTAIGANVVFRSGAPSLVGVYRKARLGRAALPLGRITRRVLPSWTGTGVCVIGRRPA